MGLPSLIATLALASVAWSQTTVIHPSRIDDVLVNPGMGIQTFQRLTATR